MIQNIRLSKGLQINLFLSFFSIAFFRAISLITGKISVNEGLGYDGVTYASMLTESLSSGGINKQLRPFLILLTRIPYYFTHDVIKSFEIMNYIYVFIFSLSLCLIFDVYSNHKLLKFFFLINILSCIAGTKVFAFYPTLIDLGCYAVISLGIFFIITDRKIFASIVCLFAILSREFSIAVPIMGMFRDIRKGSLKKETFFTYLPSIIAFIVLRIWVKISNLSTDGNTKNLISLFDLISNGFKYFGEPIFIAFFSYFLVTVWGGISMILLSQFSFCIKCLIEEYEYAVFLGLVVLVSALGDADIWRYLAYSIPVVTVLFARYSNQITAYKSVKSFSILTVAIIGTFVTQQTFIPMNIEKYFGYWFPVYWVYYSEPLRNQGLVKIANFELIWLSLFAISTFVFFVLFELHKPNHQSRI